MARTLAAGRRRFILWMLLPAVVFLLSLTLFPFIVGAFLSLTDYTLLEGGARSFLGFSNYAELMGSADFWSAFRVTVIFTIIAVLLQLAIGVGVGVAVLLHQEGKAAPGCVPSLSCRWRSRRSPPPSAQSTPSRPSILSLY